MRVPKQQARNPGSAMRKQPTTYELYKGWDGEPCSHWQRDGKAVVPGCNVDHQGRLGPPAVRWRVLAVSAKQARFFVYNDVEAASSEDGLGIVWDRERAE